MNKSPDKQTDEARLSLAVLVSGSGTNLQAIIDAIRADSLDAKIEYVVASNPDAYGIERAKAAGIETIVFQRSDYDNPLKVDTHLAKIFEARGIDYIIMAGYMRKITPILLKAFPNRVVNLHPALLPKHKGAHAIQEAFEAGDLETGITIHFANEKYDEGPILFQHKVKRLPGDTLLDLETRIHEAEHFYYPKVINALPSVRASKPPAKRANETPDK